MKERTLYKSHPSMFRSKPFLFTICLALILFYGLGLAILFFWWFYNLGTTLILTDKRTILRTGIFSKYTTEVWHKDVRNVQVGQSFMDRIFGVGYVGISSAGQSGIEVQAWGIPNPATIKRLIDEQSERF